MFARALERRALASGSRLNVMRGAMRAVDVLHD
jgi:hypothetical protein